MQASAGVRAKASKAAAVVASKKLGSMPSRRIERFGEERGELGILDQLPGNADAFVEADQMRAGEDVDLVPGSFERGAQEGAGRALAVGAGDMEDGREPVLRPAEAVEQCGDALEPEAVAGIDRRSQPVELRLDRRIGRAREVGHQAAFFSGVR